ncbi:MAG: hypothetical protein ACYDAB_12820 [bacterium]
MTLLICGLLFAAPVVPPPTLTALYAQAYGCEAALQGAAPRPGLPLRQLAHVNDSFPAPDRVWPVLPAGDDFSVDTVRAWRDRHVRVGLLLPVNPGDLVRRPDLLRRLREAEALDAVPVLAVADPVPVQIAQAATFYAAMGLPPAATYLAGGLTPKLIALPPGLYLTGPNWEGNADLALPAREFTVYGRRVLPLFPVRPDGGGVYAQLSPVVGDAGFVPNVGMRWRLLGATFDRGGDSLATGGRGQTLLWLAPMLLRWWMFSNRPLVSMLVLMTSGFAWFALSGAAFVILAGWWAIERVGRFHVLH